MSDAAPLRFGVVGYGRMGVRHVATLQKMGHVIAWVVEDFPQSAAQARAHLGDGVTVAASVALDNLLSEHSGPSHSVDAIVIATPTSTHKDLTLRCLRAGKAVFCEKPLSINSDDVRECADEADRMGHPLFIGYQRPWNRDVREVILRARLMGDHAMPLSIRMKTNDSPCPPEWYLRRAEPIFYDFMCHEFHVLCSLIPPSATWESATAVCVNFDDASLGARSAVVTLALVLPSTGARATCVIELHRNSTNGYDCTLDAMYPDRSFELRNRPRVAVGESRLGEHANVLASANDQSFFDKFDDAYVAEFEEFVRIVRTGDTAAARPHLAVKAMEMARAAHTSSIEGRTILNPSARCSPTDTHTSAVPLAVVGRAGCGLAAGRSLARDLFVPVACYNPTAEKEQTTDEERIKTQTESLPNLHNASSVEDAVKRASAVYFDRSVGASWDGLVAGVQATLLAGKHVLVHSSLCLAIAPHIGELAVAAASRGVALVLATPAIDRADVARLRSIVASGALGAVVHASGRMCVRVAGGSDTPLTLSQEDYSIAEMAAAVCSIALPAAASVANRTPTGITAHFAAWVESVEFNAGESIVSARRVAIVDAGAEAASARASCERSHVDGLHVEVFGTQAAAVIDGATGDVYVTHFHGPREHVHASGDATKGGRGVWARFHSAISNAGTASDAFAVDVAMHSAVLHAVASAKTLQGSSKN